MEWTKSNISGAELERKQQAYIKEALEMAKRSKGQDEELERTAAEKAKAERKAAEEKAEAERKAAERAAAEKQAAEEKAEAERKAAERAAAEKQAAEKRAEAERKAAKEKAERAAAEKEEAAKRKSESEKEAVEKERKDIADEEADVEELIDPEDFAELIGDDNMDEDVEDKGKDDKHEANEVGSEERGDCGNKDEELIDTSQLAHTKNPSNSSQKENAAANFNQYINLHNSQTQCNCPNCQKKRAMMQK